MSAAVEVDDLTIQYGTTTAVAGITIRAQAGEITAVLGPNGAGKTSTIETLEGYRTPTSGSVRVLGLDPRSDRASLTPQIGVMLQSGGVYPAMSAADVFALFSSFYDDPLDPGGLIETLGLGEVATSPWRRLSGGEQQRVSLGLAIIGRPSVAFLDEPTAGVDPRGRQAMRDVVTALRDRGAAVLLTTHDLDEADRLADHVVIVDRGKVVADGTPASIRSQVSPDEIRFAAAPGIDITALGAHLGGAAVETGPGEYLVTTAPTPRAIAALTAWLAERDLPVDDVRAGRQTLEDVFLRLTEEPSAAADGTEGGDGAGRARGRRGSSRGRR